MKIGLRDFSLNKRISSRTSVKRIIRSKVRVKKGFGIFTDPKKAIYNKVYKKTSFSIESVFKKRRSSVDKSKNQGISKLEKAHIRGICTNNKLICENCSSDTWAIYKDGFLIWKYNFICCDVCGKPIYKDEKYIEDFLK